MKKDNRGLTLIELLITVAILAVVIVTAAAFMLTGSQSFAKGSADSNVQSEAELAVNQIEDLIIDVNGGVDFDDNADTSTLTMYHVENDENGLPQNIKRTVTWYKTESAGDKYNNIYSSEWIVDKNSSTGIYEPKETKYENQILAENVEDFNVDVSDKAIETGADGNDVEYVRSVIIAVACLDGTGKATYATTPTITLRNRLRYGASPEEVFENTPASDDGLLLYISSTGMEGAVPVRDRVTTVERGKVYNIFVMISAGTNVNSLCNFTVEGESSGANSTITPEGVNIALDVNASEPNDYLKITATYKTNSAKYVVGWVKVIGGNSKSLDGVKIIPDSLMDFAPQYSSEISQTGLTPDDIADLQYSWSVSEPSRVESFASTNDTLSLNVIKSKENYGKVFTITLVVYCPATNQSVSDSVTYVIDTETTSDGDSLMERGKVGDVMGFHRDNWYSFNPPTKVGDANQCEIVDCEFYICDEYGNRISARDYLKQYVIINYNYGVTSPLYGGQSIGYFLTLDKDLPADQEFWIKVVISFKYADGTDWSYDRMHYVSAVHLFGETTTAQVKNYNGALNINTSFPFYYTLTAYYSNTWATTKPDVFAYEITYDYDAPAGVTIEPKYYEWSTNVDGGKRIKGSAGFDVINDTGRGWYGDLDKEVKMKSATVKVYMKEYPSVYTYCYVNFE